MPLPEEEVCCQKFQPNIFDPSRCFSCLRTKKQHSGVPAQEDSDGLSVVSSYCDVTRDRLGYEDGSLCILSPDCALYICDEEDSTTSTRDQSDYPELSGSITSEEDYLHLQDAESHPTMTRLDPPPHRPNPRAWMDEPRGRESFSRHSGSKEERERESGYFSLGRASGIRTPREKSPSPPFRHAEAGRPLPSTRSPEPKATIPFRNPDLGVPSQRRSTDVQSPDPPPISSSPPLHSESNYRQGQRCLSPTPFKVAESLGSSNRRSVDNSYSKGHTTSHSLSQHQQTGRSSSMQRGGTSLSQSTSPSRSTSPFRRTESSGSSHRQNFDSAPFSQRSSRRKGYDMSLLRNTANSEARSDSSDVKNTCSQGRADANPAYMRKANHKDTRSDPSTSPGSWRGSTLSLRSPPTSRSSSPPRRNKGADVPTNSLKSSSQSTNRGSSRSRTNGRRDLEARSPSPEYRRSSSRNRSPSPQRRRRASSQSSLSESESSHISGGSGAVGFNKEEYAMMADLPKVKTIFQRDGPGQLRRAQSRSPEREERYKPASHSREKHSYWERDESGERGRLNDRERDPRDGLDGLGRLSRSHSSTSVHTQVYLADRPAGVSQLVFPSLCYGS
ncbi:hypothetical protein ANANG_G00291260 [Anguilla anguilla]|uniref:Serine/arginine repetitive matrix protein 2-like n=1 Tax=Anguilla anguilla TaxID=7936 RepID=A0A9D3LLE6_ANGAN|nr:hypothetical protein ANANG_G00291260 [Anguilla anguilla]